MKKSREYVNNKDFHAALLAHYHESHAAKQAKQEAPPLSNYIGDCFLQIATHLSYRPNFISYTYRDDMIGDAVENCTTYVHNFNPIKYSNPFGYFTQICAHAFIRRIQKEKRHTYTKYKAIENAWQTGALYDVPDDMTGSLPQGTPDYLMYENVQDFIQGFDEANAVKREKRKVKELENEQQQESVCRGLDDSPGVPFDVDDPQESPGASDRQVERHRRKSRAKRQRAKRRHRSRV